MTHTPPDAAALADEMSLEMRISETLRRMRNHNVFSIKRRDLEDILAALRAKPAGEVTPDA